MQQVGRYTLTATLGAGGFGTVHLATDPATGEQVAVKVLDWPDHDDRRAMFRQEVAALLSVASPHVVRVRDVIDQPGLAAIVTDYVEGASLRQVLDRQGPLTGPQALSVLAGALRGLAAVHAAGLVHADLKPENILLDRSGSSRLIDFGIAGPPRALGGPDTWIGTPAYLAPEVVLGQHIDLRSDLYAVAVTLFELLAGRPPYVGPNPVATALLHVQAPVPDLRAMQAGVHEHLAVLCAQDLAKDPVWRHQNTPAFLASLDLAASAAFGPDWGTGTAVASATASVGALVGATVALLPHAGVGLLGAAPMAGPLAAAAFGAAGFAGGGAAGGLAGGGLAGGGAAGGLAGGGFAGGGAAGGVSGGVAGSGAGAAGAAGAGAAGAAGAGGAGGVGTLGGAAAAGAGGSGVAGTGGGIAASAGGAKAVIAAAAAVATIGAGAATVVLLDDDEPAAAPPPYVPALVAAYTTSPADGTADQTASVVTNEGRTVRIRGISHNSTSGGPAWGVRLASDTEGRAVVAIDGRRIAAVSGADPAAQSSIDCSCTALAAAPDGTFATLTVDATVDRFRVSDGEIERIGSTTIQDAPGAGLSEQSHYVDSILSVQEDAVLATLPADGDDEDGYYRSILSLIDLDSGEITASEDTGIGSAGLAATSTSGRYVAYKEYPGDGCLDGSITVVDLERTGADGPFAMSRFTGPDGQDQYRGTPGELNAVAFDGEELLAAYNPGGSCGADAGPSRYYRTTVGDVGSPTDPIVTHSWERDGRDIGISWRATAHDGRALGAWEAGSGDDLWIGSPRAGGTRVARQVRQVIAVGEPGTPEEIEAGPPTQREIANLAIPAGSCGDGGSTGWNQVRPIQLVDGVGEAFVDPTDPTAGGASIFEVRLLGTTDVTGDGTADAVVQLQCSGSPQALCCAGRSSILYGIVALDLARPEPVLVGRPLWGTDEGDEPRQILSARLDGDVVVTRESFIYDTGPAGPGNGETTFRYRFTGDRWILQ